MFRLKITDLLVKFPSSVIAGFVILALGTGAGGLAHPRAKDAWVYPVDSLYKDRSHRRLTEKTVATIFRDHLRDYPKGSEKKLARHLVKLCQKHRLDPAFVLSVISAESTFRTKVISSAGAIGLMQLMPDTAAWVAKKKGIRYRGKASLKNPFVNLTLGTAYLAQLRDRYEGMSPYFHVAAYNLGPARLDQLRVRPNFKPTATLVYYRNIMKGVERWRYYSARQAEMMVKQAKEPGKPGGKVLKSVEKSERLKEPNA